MPPPHAAADGGAKKPIRTNLARDADRFFVAVGSSVVIFGRIVNQNLGSISRAANRMIIMAPRLLKAPYRDRNTE